MSEDLVIPQTRWLRVYAIGTAIVWAVVMLLFWVSIRRWGEALMALLMTVWGAFVCYRLYTAQVVAADDVLTIRNYLGTRRLARDGIESFSIGNPIFRLPWGRTIFVRLENGKVYPLHVTLRTGVTKASKEAQLARLQALSAWRTSGR